MLKKLLITGGIGLLVYVVNYMRKEYDKNVDDYNDLIDSYNEMSDFIQGCDFYNYKDPKATDKNTRYIKESHVMEDGSTQTITHDVATGFSIITSNKDA